MNKKDLLFIIHSGEEQLDTKKLATQSAEKTGGEGGGNEMPLSGNPRKTAAS